MTVYLELADYLLIAEAVLGLPAELIADFNRISLADAALAAPQAGSRHGTRGIRKSALRGRRQEGVDAVTTDSRGMGDDHPNALAYLRTAQAFRQADFDAVASLIAEDVVWHVPGDHPLAGDWEGRDRVLQRLATLSSLGFTLREHDVFGDDDHVCALSYMGARRDGLEVETRVVSIFHFREGRQTERWFYPDDAVAWNSIFGG